MGVGGRGHSRAPEGPDAVQECLLRRRHLYQVTVAAVVQKRRLGHDDGADSLDSFQQRSSALGAVLNAVSVVPPWTTARAVRQGCYCCLDGAFFDGVNRYLTSRQV